MNEDFNDNIEDGDDYDDDDDDDEGNNARGIGFEGGEKNDKMTSIL